MMLNYTMAAERAASGSRCAHNMLTEITVASAFQADCFNPAEAGRHV
jgi:hypothetical protein